MYLYINIIFTTERCAIRKSNLEMVYHEKIHESAYFISQCLECVTQILKVPNCIVISNALD